MKNLPISLMLVLFFMLPFIAASGDEPADGSTIEELANTPASEAPPRIVEETETPSETTPPPQAAPSEAPRWTGSLPEDLIRPTRAAPPVYPRDAVIGSLGAGEAGEEAYRYIRAVLTDMLSGRKNSGYLRGLPAAEQAAIFDKLTEAQPRKVRAGGGLIEPDGSISFLFRFLGREKEICGSIYIVSNEESGGSGHFTLDSVLLENVSGVLSGNDLQDYEYLPFARVY